jgi:hypothetical protein
MRVFLKVFTWLCKITAILFWLGVAWVKIGFDISNLRAPSHWSGEDWGTPAFEHRTYLEIATLIALLVLAVLPNRWQVFSLATFTISLLIVLIPFYQIFDSLTEWSDLLSMMPLMSLFATLPLSLIASFVRQRKGEKIGYG